ncbi:MAG: NAD(P)H-hydrate dehydratase [Clostridia bacterium]|nr:NAD(P)H-hydrate dehydratase [Clostridia bacterium]
MHKVLNNEQMRISDGYTIKTLGVPSSVLMERAGIALAQEVKNAITDKQNQNVLVVCGNGNNGGDGYVCAQALLKENYSVKVYAFSGKLSPDCEREKANYKGEYSSEISADIIVDCIFGTGIARKVEGEFESVINAINKSGAIIISADIPSGLNGDNGCVLGVAVKANLTVAIAEYKLGHFLNDGKDYCGKVIKKDIGISLSNGNYAQIYQENDIKNLLPVRLQNSHKGTFGTANIIAGSTYCGAAALSISSALKSGCGYVYLTCKNSLKNALVATYPQAIYQKKPNFSANSIAIGMGEGCLKATYNKTVKLLKNYSGNLIIDADALNSLARYGVEVLKQKKCNVLITPHVKEFSRLTKISVQEIIKNPVKYASDFAIEYGVTVLLKSCTSVIANGTQTAINIKGSTALSKGGSGDILSGLICGVAAQGVNLFNSAVISSYLVGETAEICQEKYSAYATTSADIIKKLHKAFLRLTK